MALVPYPGFCEGSYTARSNIADCERSINLYPELITDATGKSRTQLYGTPGSSTYSNTIVPVSNIPVSMKTFANQTLGGFGVVASINPSPAGTTVGIAGLRGGAFGSATIGTGSGTFAYPGSVFMDYNGSNVLAFINQNAAFGSSAIGSQPYLWTPGGLSATWQGSWQSSGLNTQLVTGLCFLDGYFFASTLSGNLYNSNVNDPTTWNSLNFTFVNDQPDGLVTCASAQRQVWLFGSQRIEAYYDAGLSGFPLQRVPGGVIGQGLAYRYTLCFADNSFFWLGQDAHGRFVVYRNEGYTAVRISNHAIETQIANAFNSANPPFFGIGSQDYMGPTSYMYQEAGHLFYVLNLGAVYPSAAGFNTSGNTSPNTTFVYDVSNGMWHERQSGGTRNIAHLYAYDALSGSHVVSSYLSSGLSTLSNSTFTELGGGITRTRIATHLSEEGLYNFYHSFVLDCEVGTEASGTQNFTLSWSDDGGQTFNAGVALQVGSGGNYKARAIWRRLGKARDRVFKLTTSDQMQVALINAYLDLEPGY